MNLLCLSFGVPLVLMPFVVRAQAAQQLKFMETSVCSAYESP